MPMGLMTSVLSLTTLRPMDLDIKAVVNPEAKQVVMRTLFFPEPPWAKTARDQNLEIIFTVLCPFLDPAGN